MVRVWCTVPDTNAHFLKCVTRWNLVCVSVVAPIHSSLCLGAHAFVEGTKEQMKEYK